MASSVHLLQVYVENMLPWMPPVYDKRTSLVIGQQSWSCRGDIFFWTQSPSLNTCFFTLRSYLFLMLSWYLRICLAACNIIPSIKLALFQNTYYFRPTSTGRVLEVATMISIGNTFLSHKQGERVRDQQSALGLSHMPTKQLGAT